MFCLGVNRSRPYLMTCQYHLSLLYELSAARFYILCALDFGIFDSFFAISTFTKKVLESRKAGQRVSNSHI